MYTLVQRQIYASEIAEFLNADLIGDDIIVTHPATFHSIDENSITFIDKKDYKAPNIKNVLLVLKDELTDISSGISQIILKNPQLDFFRIVNEFYIKYKGQGIDKTAIVEDGAQVGRNLFVDRGAFISKETVLANNIKIMKNVILNGSVKIGDNGIIKYGSVIGSEGYSFVLDENKIPIHFPQIGGVKVGDNVWIGSNTTIEKAFLGETIIEDNVKIDDLVHIGGNCIIGASSMITSGVVIATNTKIGKNCWLAPNSSIGNDIVIGDNVTIGMGSVVLKNCEENGVYVGNPARLVKKKENK